MKNITVTAVVILAAATALPLLAEAAADGAKLYEKHCLKCHGATGKGDGKSAKLFDPKPNDFSAAKWQAEVSDEQIVDATKFGKKATKIKVGKKMPAFEKKMKDDEIQAMVTVIRGFAEKK